MGNGKGDGATHGGCEEKREPGPGSANPFSTMLPRMADEREASKPFSTMPPTRGLVEAGGWSVLAFGEGRLPSLEPAVRPIAIEPMPPTFRLVDANLRAACEREASTKMKP